MLAALCIGNKKGIGWQVNKVFGKNTTPQKNEEVQGNQLRSLIVVLGKNKMGWRFFTIPGGLDLGQQQPVA